MKNKVTDPVPTTKNKENGLQDKLVKQASQLKDHGKNTELPAQDLAGSKLTVPKPKPIKDPVLHLKVSDAKEPSKSPRKIEEAELSQKIHVISEVGKTTQKFKIQEKKEAPDRLIGIENQKSAYKIRLEEIKGLPNLRMGNLEGYTRDKKRRIIRHTSWLSLTTK